MSFGSAWHYERPFVAAAKSWRAPEKIESYYGKLLPLWQTAQSGMFEIVSSELLLLETLVKPLQTADAVLETAFRAMLLSSREVRLLPITTTILEDAARLRAMTGIKTPDAIHAATALATGCTLFVTNDRALSRVPGLPIAVLSAII